MFAIQFGDELNVLDKEITVSR